MSLNRLLIRVYAQKELPSFPFSKTPVSASGSRSLLVLLNHSLGTLGCLIRVLTSRTSGPSLSKEIPALIEFEFDLP